MCPILDWNLCDVWTFLDDIVKVEHCRLYDEGSGRLGCLFCPFDSPLHKRMLAEKYPSVVRSIKRAIKDINDNGYLREYTTDVDEIFDFYISNKTPKEYFDNKQLKLF